MPFKFHVLRTLDDKYVATFHTQKQLIIFLLEELKKYKHYYDEKLQRPTNNHVWES